MPGISLRAIVEACFSEGEVADLLASWREVKKLQYKRMDPYGIYTKWDTVDVTKDDAFAAHHLFDTCRWEPCEGLEYIEFMRRRSPKLKFASQWIKPLLDTELWTRMVKEDEEKRVQTNRLIEMCKHAYDESKALEDLNVYMYKLNTTMWNVQLNPLKVNALSAYGNMLAQGGHLVLIPEKLTLL